MKQCLFIFALFNLTAYAGQREKALAALALANASGPVMPQTDFENDPISARPGGAGWVWDESGRCWYRHHSAMPSSAMRAMIASTPPPVRFGPAYRPIYYAPRTEACVGGS